MLTVSGVVRGSGNDDILAALFLGQWSLLIISMLELLLLKLRLLDLLDLPEADFA